MKQRLLFEGELSDPGLDEVLPELISKAIYTEQDVFVLWNGAFIRVRPTDTVEKLMAEYEEQLSAMHRKNAPKDGCDKILYRVTNGLGAFYVVSKTFDEAADLLHQRLDKADYGFTSSRLVKSVEVLAVEHFSNDVQSFCNDNERLIVEG